MYDHTKQNVMTSPLTSVTSGNRDFVKCCIKSRVHLNLPPDNKLFGRLQYFKSLPRYQMVNIIIITIIIIIIIITIIITIIIIIIIIIDVVVIVII